ncbi:hypothetical protein GOB86_09300 [Acetobacter lambici]|uniref:Uncharacterized protein n=1 Tax=Acetobacter lambici TaxID=1332824 RepID=A0ABT1F1H6_9PROT|nr:hypothetical protein [Acetobacter lambici]MCP1242890.1 hypothetical protein [Acetobacter lambici]MCP1259060.1 hypothetical protein [Acetobacter lambici]NHO57253.1 hypothetical protein [Acetobacter lambici]
MGKGQSFCRGQIALYGKKPVLILALDGAVCLAAKLYLPRTARHRSDIDLSETPLLLRNTIVRAADLLRCRVTDLRPMADGLLCVGEGILQRVERAARREMECQASEQLPAGVVRSTWRAPRWGSCGRKIGGVPSE